MATKRKKKQPEAEAPKRARPSKRAKKRKAAKRRPARSAGAKRTKRPLQLVLSIADIPINSPALAPLSDAQRVDLAAMDPRKTLSTRPAWAADETAWRKAVRVVGPHWKRLRHPWPVVAWAYLRMDGAVSHARGLEGSDRERDEQPRGKRRAAARAPAPRSSSRAQYADELLDDAEPVRVERLPVDATGIDNNGNYRGQGIWWRVWNASLDSVVRAATASAARAIVTGRAH